MKYRTLKSIWYEDKDHYKTEKDHRANSLETVQLPLMIHHQPSFYVPDINAINLIETINKKETKISNLYNALPRSAKELYAISCLIDEIHYSNDIEGVRSTQKEIKKAYDLLQTTGEVDNYTRFSSIVNKYVKFNSDEMISLSSAQDIRALYDEIILPEINEADFPDGQIFRMKDVYVIDASGETIHTGISGEEAIIQSMDQALSVLKLNIPACIKISILHYYIGYIHPFYDGNGRLNRFISSYLLTQSFDSIISYHLSYIIQKSKKRYYDAFETCNDKINSGDITPFVLTFMEIINDSIDEILDKVQGGTELLNKYSDMIKEYDINNEQKRLLFYLVQNALFSIMPFTAQELAILMEKNPQTIKRNINRLIQSGYPIVLEKDGHKNTYRIDLNLL
jgi:Fic family protein